MACEQDASQKPLISAETRKAAVDALLRPSAILDALKNPMNPYRGYDEIKPAGWPQGSQLFTDEQAKVADENNLRYTPQWSAAEIERFNAIRAQVAKQQAKLLDEMAKDAVAPAAEVARGTALDEVARNLFGRDRLRAAFDRADARISGSLAGGGGGVDCAPGGQAAQGQQATTPESSRAGERWAGRFKPLSADPYRDTVTLSGMQWEAIKGEMKRWDALERQIRWLHQAHDSHAKLIASLQRQTGELFTRVKDLEHKLNGVRFEFCDYDRKVEVVPDRPVAYGNGLASQVSVGPVTTVPLTRSSAQTVIVDSDSPIMFGDSSGPTSACEHDLQKPNTTVSAITRKKARCNVCAKVWESA